MIPNGWSRWRRQRWLRATHNDANLKESAEILRANLVRMYSEGLFNLPIIREYLRLTEFLADVEIVLEERKKT